MTQTLKIKVPVTPDYEEKEFTFPAYRKWKNHCFYKIVSPTESIQCTYYEIQHQGYLNQLATNNDSEECTEAEFMEVFNTTLERIKSLL